MGFRVESARGKCSSGAVSPRQAGLGSVVSLGLQELVEESRGTGQTGLWMKGKMRERRCCGEKAAMHPGEPSFKAWPWPPVSE